MTCSRWNTLSLSWTIRSARDRSRSWRAAFMASHANRRDTNEWALRRRARSVQVGMWLRNRVEEAGVI
jgi:hypothetical protein